MCAIFASKLYALLLHTSGYGPFISLSLFFFFWNKTEASSCVEWHDRRGKLNSAAENWWGLGGGLFFSQCSLQFSDNWTELGGKKNKLLLTRKMIYKCNMLCILIRTVHCWQWPCASHYTTFWQLGVCWGHLWGVTFCSTEERSKAGECSCLLATTQGCLLPALLLPNAVAPQAHTGIWQIVLKKRLLAFTLQERPGLSQGSHTVWDQNETLSLHWIPLTNKSPEQGLLMSGMPTTPSDHLLVVMTCYWFSSSCRCNTSPFRREVQVINRSVQAQEVPAFPFAGGGNGKEEEGCGGLGKKQ